MTRDRDGATSDTIEAVRQRLSVLAPRVAAALDALSMRHPSVRQDHLLHRALGRLIDLSPPRYRQMLSDLPIAYAPSTAAQENARFHFFSRRESFPNSGLLKVDYEALNARTAAEHRVACSFYLSVCAFLWERVEKNPMVKPTVAPRERPTFRVIRGGRS